MTPELQQFMDEVQKQLQAAQGPLQDLWTGSQYIVIAAIAVLAGTFLLLLLGLLTGAISRSRKGKQIRTLEEGLRVANLRTRQIEESGTDERAKLRRGFDTQLAELKATAEQEIAAAKQATAEAEALASESLAERDARHKNEIAQQKKAAEDALIREREYHRTEINRLKDESAATAEALRVLKSQGQGSDGLRSQIEELKRQVRDLQSTLDSERERYTADVSRLEAEKRRAEENARALSGSTNSELQRECERLQQQLEAVLAAPLTGSLAPQLDAVEMCLNTAIELYATRDIDGAVASLSNAAQIVGQLKRAENQVL